MFLENMALSHTTQVFSTILTFGKTNERIPRKCLGKKTDGQIKGGTLKTVIYRTLLVATVGPKSHFSFTHSSSEHLQTC